MSLMTAILQGRVTRGATAAPPKRKSPGSFATLPKRKPEPSGPVYTLPAPTAAEVAAASKARQQRRAVGQVPAKPDWRTAFRNAFMAQPRAPENTALGASKR